MYRDRLKGMQILLSRTQAEQLSKSRNKILATTYKPFSRSLYKIIATSSHLIYARFGADFNSDFRSTSFHLHEKYRYAGNYVI